MTLNLSDSQHNKAQPLCQWHYAECHVFIIIMLNVVMLNVVMLNVVMMNVIMLNVVMLNPVMLDVVMLNIVAPAQATLPRSNRLGWV